MAQDEERVKIIFDTNAKQASGDVNKLGSSIDNATNATNENNDAVEQGNAAYKTFKAQLREANQELQKQIQLTGESSQETIKAAKAVADLKDQMGFASDLADSFNPDQKMKALGAATRVAATGVQGVTAGMALFGDQSEDTQKALLKVQAAMAFSDAISGLSDLGDQWQLLKNTISASSVATKANTAATGAAAMIQNLFTGSVNTSSAGFKGLKLAIAGTGIGLLVVGLALVVTNFSKIKDVVLKVVPGLASVGKLIGSIVDSVTDFIGVTSEADRAADRLKANAEKRSREIDRILKEDGSRYSESAKKKMAINKQLQDDIAEGTYNEQKLRKEAAFAIAQIDKENAGNARKLARENAEKAEKEREEREQKAKELIEKKAKDEADALKKKQEDLFNEGQEFFKNAQEVQKTNDQADADLKKEQLDRLNAIDVESLDFETQKAIKQSEIDKKNLDNKIAVDSALKDLGNQGVSAAKDLFAKNKNIQKGIVVAESGVALGKLAVNTVEAVSKDNAASPLTFGMPWAGIHIGQGVLGAASIISATNKQLQALGGGSAPSASGVSGGSGVRGSAPPAVAFNNTAENQIGQSVAKTQSDQPPLKVYVSESDISDAQNNVKVLVNKNVF